MSFGRSVVIVNVVLIKKIIGILIILLGKVRSILNKFNLKDEFICLIRCEIFEVVLNIWGEIFKLINVVSVGSVKLCFIFCKSRLIDKIVRLVCRMLILINIRLVVWSEVFSCI